MQLFKNPVLTHELAKDDWMVRCSLRRPELALRNPRVRKESLYPRIHDRRHGWYVSYHLMFDRLVSDECSVMSVAVTYMPLFMPPPPTGGLGSGTEAPAAAAVPTP